jgi:predicted dehydrogenase
VPVLTSAASGAVSQLRGQKRNRIGHKVIIQKFVESLLNNTEPPVTGEDDRETIRVLEEIWKQISQPTSSLEG